MMFSRRARSILVLIIFFGFIAAPVLATTMVLNNSGLLSGEGGGKKVKLTIPEGATVTDIGALLETKGVIKSAFGFRLASYLNGGTENVQAGEYTIATGLSARDALDAVLEGPEIEFVTVTIPEGSWLPEIAAGVEDDTGLKSKKFLSALESKAVKSKLLPKGSTNFEGMLFPSTYQVIEDDSAESVAKRMVDEMEERVGRLDLSTPSALGYSQYEVVVVASMIQAESRLPSEQPKIARVIYNRLEDKTPLGIDATVIYAHGERKNSLTNKDLAIDSPYNTRKVVGLPPTPIGAPGAAALRAAADPAKGNWYYYVLKDCDGSHAFSVDYDDFLADKANYENLDC
jgi:UPF0755 protein